MNLRPCVLYARKSTDRDDKQTLSIPAQLRELREYAARSGLTITSELKESWSARKPGRPVFTKLLKDAAAGRVERILAWRLDRLARNPVDGGQLIYLLGERKVKELVTPDGVYTGAGDSKFMLAVHFGVATKMTDDLAAGVRRGNREVFLSGRINGKPPIGYIKVRERAGYRGAGRVVPDPDRFVLVERIWRELLTGTRTVSEVQRLAAKEWGLTTMAGPNRPSRRVSLSHVYQLVQNRFYAGQIVRNGEVFGGEHKSMVTVAEFERVQQLVRHPHGPRPVGRRFLYAGMLFCDMCGTLFSGERHERASGKVYTNYRCGARQPSKPPCRSRAPSEASITADIERELERATLSPEIAAWTLEVLPRWLENERGGAEARVKALDEAIARVGAELVRLKRLVIQGILHEQDYLESRAEAELQLDQLRRERANPAAELGAWEAAVRELVEVGCRLAPVFREADDDGKRALLARVSPNTVIAEGKARLSWAFPFDVLPEVSALAPQATAASPNTAPTLETALNQTKNALTGAAASSAFSVWCAPVDSND